MKDLDWTKFCGGTPREGIVHLKGEKKEDSIKRMREAFRKIR